MSSSPGSTPAGDGAASRAPADQPSPLHRTPVTLPPSKIMNETEHKVLAERDRRPLGRTMLCQNCAYWEISSYSEATLAEDNTIGPFSDVSGECRRRAPVPQQHIVLHTGQLTAQAAYALNIMANIKIDENDDYELGSVYEDQVHEWPMTNANAWCGEFKRKEK